MTAPTQATAREAVELPEPHVLNGHYRDHTDKVNGYSEAQVRALLAAKQEELDKVRAELLPLQLFVDAVFGEFPEHGDIDGFDLQEIAEGCGLLKAEATMTPCGENCACMDNGISEGVITQCYRVQPAMSRARVVAAKHNRAALSPSQQGE